MTTTVRAIYDGGVFRPLKPVPYSSGQAVELLIAPTESGVDPILERLNAANTLEEAYAIADAIPADPDDEYDIEAALNASRGANGERLLFPMKPERAAS